ncbi:MAG TPA: hypothetical protein VGG39_37100 [Polyangiaceae bacterium]|jgi:hypothetical protein
MATSFADAREALAALRAAVRDRPASGPSFAAEAARDSATEILRRLGGTDDAFLVACLEEAAAGLQGEACQDAAVECGAIFDAMEGRACPGVEGVLERIAMQAPGSWLQKVLVEILRKWDAPRFESILRAAALRHPTDSVRASAAEVLVAAGLAPACGGEC